MNDPLSTGGLGIELDSSLFIYLILIPSVVSVFALLFGGILADSLIKRGFKVITVRKTVNTIGFFGSSIFLILIPFQDSLVNILVLLCLVNTCSGICQGGFGVNHADLGPKYTGSLVGMAGSIGMIAAIFSPIAAGYVLEFSNSWNLIFYVCSGILVIGGLYYLIFASAEKQFD